VIAKSRYKKTDIVVGLVLIGFAIVAFCLALQINPGPAINTLPPNTFPILCSIGIGSCGVILFIQGLARATTKPLPIIFDCQQVLILALMALFFLSFEKIDFRVGIGGFVFLTMYLLGCRDMKQLLLVSFFTVIGIWIVFTGFFKILLPTWI
jgi:hypothetical protein